MAGIILSMSHVSLYRKYRPATFKDVIGQERVVLPLVASLASGEIAHAYLLTGSRGVGKTTIARIIAHELKTNPNDITEMDAASNRGIDDIRELRDGIRTLPFDSKYKIYILDEVHMLSKDAWGALLKTLEEPPAHVVFILCTTELEKVPETIISRCQTYRFTAPTETVLAKLATDVAKKEGYTLDTETSALIATLGDGSFRDTLGLLQKVLTSADGKKISIDDAAKVLGAPQVEVIETYITALAQDSLDDALSALHNFEQGGGDAALFAELLLGKLRLILAARYAKGYWSTLKKLHSEREVSFAQTSADTKSPRLTSKTLELFLAASNQVKHSPVPLLPLELATMELFSA